MLGEYLIFLPEIQHPARKCAGCSERETSLGCYFINRSLFTFVNLIPPYSLLTVSLAKYTPLATDVASQVNE